MRGRKPIAREIQFFLVGSTKEHKALHAKFATIQTVVKNSVQMRLEDARRVVRAVAKNLGTNFNLEWEGEGYDFTLTIFLGDKDAALEIEQRRPA